MSVRAVGRVPARIRWVGVLAVAGAIFHASVLAPPPVPGPEPPAMGPFGLVRLDKWLHATAYAGLATALAVAVADRRPYGVAAVALVVGAAAGYGLAIELVQWPLPDRTFDLADMAANAVGATVVVPLWWAAAAADGRFGRRS